MSFGAAAAIVATIAGIATVHAFRPPSGQSDAPSKVERQVVPEHLSAVRGGRTKASFEANRPPVPIVRTDRPRDERIAGASGNGVSRDESAASASSSGEGIARAAIERDGYKGVSSLRRRSDGLWSGRALRGSVQIEVTVDSV